MPFDAIHELSLMVALAERVLEVAAREQSERVLAIHLRVGHLAGVDPLALRTAAEIVLAGTVAQGARLAIEEVPPAWWCGPCGMEFLASDVLGRCPACGLASRQVLRGQELLLHALELDP
ncbi:MAG: hydrogenase maturation nickel metallochaperone HypA [Cyanobacteriota bacterium]|nr:hydrogenase maturation nickel metallochaperone HypA [Cyanobacteriota bacterium]